MVFPSEACLVPPSRGCGRRPGWLAWVVAGVWLAAAASAQTLICEGVLGNSGVEGAHLVRFNPQPASGIGVVLDRHGTLWDRAGNATLNRYAPDGRLLAQYTIPAGSNRDRDQIALAGDTVVLLVGGKLLTLAIAAPAGTAATPLEVPAACLSPSAHGGRVAAVSEGKVVLVDIPGGATTPVTDGEAQWIELGPDGAVYATRDWTMHKFVAGQAADAGWPRRCPGERPQRLGESWFCHAWHGTVKRFTADLEPDPGVVLGGASGSFIGHLDENAELVNGRGLAQVTDRLYAVSGLDGILHLMEWDGTTRQMTLIRRLGAVTACSGLGLDCDGRVFYRAGSWEWSDRPDTPLRFGVNGPEAPGVGQPVMLDGRILCAPAFLWGQPSFYSGPLDRHVRAERIGDSCALRRGFVGSATYLADGRRLLLVVDTKGAGQAFRIGADGRYAGEAGEVRLETATPLEGWTSLGMTADGALLAAAAGQVVVLNRDGANWREARRWASWGTEPEARFGPTVYLHTDGGRLWVADTDRHRILVFPEGGGVPVASFGHTDRPGTDLASLSAPAVIAACGARAVVHDRDNQRLLKLALE